MRAGYKLTQFEPCDEEENSNIIQISTIRIPEIPNALKKLMVDGPEDGDRSANDFHISASLARMGWSSEQIADAMRDEEYYLGFGNKYRERNNDEKYLTQTIENAFKEVQKEGTGGLRIGTEKTIPIRNSKPELWEKFDRIYAYAQPDGKITRVEIENGDFRFIPSKEYDLLIDAMARTVYPGTKKIDTEKTNRYALALHEHVNNRRLIVNSYSKVIPFGETSCKINQLENGRYEMCRYISLEESLKMALRKLQGVQRIKNLEQLITEEYQEVLDIFDAALARKFSGSKKSTIWFHCPSNYGKTFLLNVADMILFVEKSYDDKTFRGFNPSEFDKYLMIFVDEAEKFIATMKNDTLSYHRLYHGHTKANLPMRVLGSANEIRDLSGGMDQQLINRVTKVKPKESEIKEKLTEIGLTTDEAKASYDLFIITRALDKLEQWKKVTDADVSRVKWIAGKEFDTFLEKYDGNLEAIDIKDMVIDEMNDILNELFNPETLEKINKDDSFDSSYYNGFERHFKVDSGKLYLISVSQFLEEFMTHRLREKQYTFRKAYPHVEAFGDIFSKYKLYRMSTGTPRKCIRLNYKIAKDEENKDIFKLKTAQ